MIAVKFAFSSKVLTCLHTLKASFFAHGVAHCLSLTGSKPDAPLLVGLQTTQS